jgi:hypothetical protein
MKRLLRDRFGGVMLSSIVVALLAETALLQAEVGTLAWYRMGEAGGTAGNTVTNCADSSGNGFALDVVEGNQVWSADTPTAAGHNLPLGASVLSVKLTPPGFSYRNAGGETNSQVTAATDNVGIEAWVKSGSLEGVGVIAYNGYTFWPPYAGFGLMQLPPGSMGHTNAVYVGDISGVAIVGSAPASTNEWTHLALVRDSAAFGGWRFYVNGVLNGTNAAPGSAAAGTLEIGAGAAVPGGAMPFQGWIDEVRVFSFPSGQFTPSDLNVTPP